MPNAELSPEQGMRRAALSLHRLSAEDQGWVLGQLPDAQGARLRVLLDELTALGIPADIAGEALGHTDTHQPVVSLSPTAVATLLREEPVPLAAAAVVALRLPAGQILEAWEPPLRRKVEAHLGTAGGRMTAHAQKALAALVSDRSHDIDVGAPVGVSRRWRLAWRS